MIKNITEIDVSNKRVLVRCDFNVPLDDQGNITDDFRIKQTIPTIQYLISKNAKVILMSHLDPESTGVADKKYTLDNVAHKVSDYLGITIEKENDCVGPEVETVVNALEAKQVLLLENLRFYKEETAGDMDFAKKLSYLGDIYVNDAFGACHRNHASMTGVPTFLPHFAGLLLEKEITALDKVMTNPEKPMVAVVGGTKVETKATFINTISGVADVVLVGGLLKAEMDEKKIPLAHPEKIIGPIGDLKALDINDETITLFSEKIMSAKTILWNGAVGKFEDAQYAKGTLAVANAIITSKAFSVAGGGETVEFLEKQSMLDRFSHVSTGGGAMISYLSGEKLPGIEALNT